MTTIYEVGDFPRNGPWVVAVPRSESGRRSETERQAEVREATDLVAAFLVESTSELGILSDLRELQAVIDVLAASNPARFVDDHNLGLIYYDLRDIDRRAQAGLEHCEEWLWLHSTGSCSVTKEALPNPWLEAQRSALHAALQAHGLPVDQDERVLPLLCLVWAFHCVQNSEVRRDRKRLEERLEQEEEERRQSPPVVRPPYLNRPQ